MRILILLLVLVVPFSIQSQNLKKLGLKKAAGAIKKVIEEDDPQEDSKENESGQTAKSGSEDNKKSLDKEMTEEEVLMALDDAIAAADAKDYSNARYSVEEVLVEIEKKLGQQVLDKMPTEVLGISYDPEEDLVMSTGVGFIGLDIKREYISGDDKIDASIANNSAILTPYKMALSNPQMVAQEDDMKVVKVNGKRSILELDEYDDSFTLYTPFGESSVFIMKCNSCEDEDEIVSAAEKFDLDAYLIILGETPHEIVNEK